MVKKKTRRVPVAKSQASVAANSNLFDVETTSSSSAHDRCPADQPTGERDDDPRWNFEMRSGTCVMTTDYGTWRGWCVHNRFVRTPKGMNHNIGERSLEEDLKDGDLLGSRSKFDPLKPTSVLSNFVTALKNEVAKYEHWEKTQIAARADDAEPAEWELSETSRIAGSLCGSCHQTVMDIDDLLFPLNSADEDLLEGTLNADGVGPTIKLKALRMEELLYRKSTIDCETFAEFHDLLIKLGKLATKYTKDDESNAEFKTFFEGRDEEYARIAKNLREQAAECKAEATSSFKKFAQAKGSAECTNEEIKSILSQPLELLRTEIATFNLSLPEAKEKDSSSNVVSKGKDNARESHPRPNRGVRTRKNLGKSTRSTPIAGRLHIREFVWSESPSTEEKWSLVLRSLPRTQSSRGPGRNNLVKSFTNHLTNTRWFEAGNMSWRDTVIGTNFARRPIMEDPPFKPQPLLDPRWAEATRRVQAHMKVLDSKRDFDGGNRSMRAEARSAPGTAMLESSPEEDETDEAQEPDDWAESQCFEVQSEAGDFTGTPLYELPARSFSFPDLRELSTAFAEDDQP